MDPNIKRIGKYKSAGDQLLRKDMSEAQREQLTAILDDLYEGFTDDVAASKNKSPAEVPTTAQQQTLLVNVTVAVCCVHTWCLLSCSWAFWVLFIMACPFPSEMERDT